MGNPSAAHEPSMEEILASIRQIISEDGEQSGDEAESSGGGDASAIAESAEAGGAAPEMAAADPDPAGETAEDFGPSDEDEDEAMTAAAPARPPEAPQPQPAEAPLSHRPAAQPAQPADTAAPPPSRPAAATGPLPRQSEPASGGGGLTASAAMRGEGRGLLSPQADASVSGAFSALAHTILAQNARTLEDLVSEMLRPMLKDWLDDNLPPLVERLVREEIERVSRGRH